MSDWIEWHGSECPVGPGARAQVELQHGNRLDRLRAELERERMRLAACGAVASANTPETAAEARKMHDDYRSASCDDVAAAVDREMRLRKENAALREALDLSIAAMEAYEEKVDREWGMGRSISEIEFDGDLPDCISFARAALQGAKK